MSNQHIYDDKDLDLFETHRKSRSTGYIALFLTGVFGGHRHYLGYGGSGFIQTLLGGFIVVGLIKIWPYFQPLDLQTDAALIYDTQADLWLLGVAAAILILGLWLLIDLFRIPALAAKKNRKLISRLAAAPSAQACPTDVIAKFAALRANGTISEEEFTACKQQIMGITPSAAPPASDGAPSA